MHLLNVEVRIIFLALNTVSAKFISNFLKNKLLQRFPMKKAMFAMLYTLKLSLRKKIIYGFKILFSGRFSRRDRASYF